MLLIPQKNRTKVITNEGIVGTQTPGTAVVSNATTLLDGAVTEIISAANNIQDSWGFHISISSSTSPAGLADEKCLDVLIGGATDTVLIPALICGHASQFQTTMDYLFPLHIPAGQRIAASLASVVVSANSQVVVKLYGGGAPPWKVGRKVTTYGTQVNNARGKLVAPTASGGAASVTEMTASTAEDHFAFMVGFQPETDTTVTAKNYNIGIGVGASTEDRIGTWLYKFTANEEAFGPTPCIPAFCPVPAGSRLSMLAGCSGTVDAAYGGLIYAVS